MCVGVGMLQVRCAGVMPVPVENGGKSAWGDLARLAGMAMHVVTCGSLVAEIASSSPRALYIRVVVAML